MADGPAIPDELLVARDEGRLIFFCGAGVSRARAGLSDFFGLAQQVIEELGVGSDSPVRRIIEVARQTNSMGMTDLISADRVFAQLESEFLSTDIQAAVAKALKPTSTTDLSAHRLVLDLARWPDGKVRLVTTNFDRLFESCDNRVRSWKPPSLPSPQQYEDFDGVIHLHGRVDDAYTGADGGGFVLSSGEFGRAYLSDAWATQFIRSILDKYLVVFLGYTADDPPVQYLLQALNRSVESRQGLYAFQSGTTNEAQSRWLHKGVQPIPYDGSENHKALWDTFAEWAVRARNPDAWYENVIALARQGPQPLKPHERGQVAHIVSTLEGVKKFSASTDPPPAEWLCVLDPSVRYSKPGRVWSLNGQGPYFDPFAAYGLDSDPVPPKTDPDDYLAKREVPENVWDCFAATRMDRQNLDENSFPAFRNHWATHVPRLPARLARLGTWIVKVCNDPAAVWWTAGQTGLHPDIQSDIRFQLERTQATYSPEMRKAWHYLLEALESPKNTIDYRWFELKSSIKVDGWTNAIVRQLAQIYRPRLTAKRPWSRPKPPVPGSEVSIRDVVELDVEYPKINSDIQIADEYIGSVVREFRKNLEHAVCLEEELGGQGLSLLPPIEPDPNLAETASGRGHGIAGSLLFYVGLFRKLVEKDTKAAKQECLAWRIDDETAFAALRIWASGDHRIFSSEEAGTILCSLNDHVFWHSKRQRDLLLILAKRWSNFPGVVKTTLSNRLLDGPPKWDEEQDGEYEERRAWSSLNRIEWLHSRGCEFDFDITAERLKLRKRATRWQPEYAEKTADSMEMRGGRVRTDTEHKTLLDVPLAEVLDKAKELSGRTHEMLVENNPFAGLASNRPVRAFSALTISGKNGEYPTWAWRTFLNSEARKSDKPKLSALIAERAARLPPPVLVEIFYSVCDWLLTSSGVLLKHFPMQFERLWTKLISELRVHPEIATSSIVRGNKEPDWPMEGLNSPVGKLAQVLMNDPAKDVTQNSNGLPIQWGCRASELLSLQGDRRRHALVIFAHNLNWFFARDRQWTEEHLLSAISSEDENAFWAGFFWGSQVPNRELFIRLKPQLLNLAINNALADYEYSEVLAGILLAGWTTLDVKTGERYVTNSQMRDVLIAADDDFRSNILWRLERLSEAEEDRDNHAKQLSVFLDEVWPRQKSVKTPRMTARLCNLAFADSSAFPQRVNEILPLVTKIDQTTRHELVRLEDAKVSQYPDEVVALLSAILPENAAIWPYGIESTLETIQVSKSSLARDPRLIELMRRWNAR